MMELAGDFSGRVALVTGAASGIGRATARAIAAKGARLALIDVDGAGLETTLAELSGKEHRARSLDLSDSTALRRVFSELLDDMGRIDMLANVAGLRRIPDRLDAIDPALWQAILAVNVVAPAILIELASAAMIMAGIAGRIVNVTSSSAHRANPGMAPAYAASKAALAALTRTAAAELGRHGITVNSVAPGITITDMALRTASSEQLEAACATGPLANLIGRPAQSEDVAATILYLCSDASRQITGQVIHTSGGALV